MNYGELLATMGDRANAIRRLEEAVKLAPTEELRREAHDMIQRLENE